MSEVKRKVVRMTESKLVDLIDNIVKEAVEEQKKQWIAEQEQKAEGLLESRIIELESKIKSLTESK